MHPLEKKITNLLKSKPLFADCHALVVGVSGGPDSMALLHVLAACLGEDVAITAVYVNHGLRPAETGGEEKLVQKLALKLGANFATCAVDVRRYAEREKISIEHSARDLRYAFLQETAAKYGTKKIAVAHTADDQAEELLLRMIRGAGRRGLSGMDYINDENIVRPFLDIEKAELLAYLKDKKIPHAQDSSNQERVYLRNRVRLDLVPFLEEGFNPGVKKNLRRLADVFRGEEDLLDDLANKAFAATVSTFTPALSDDNVFGLEINVDKFNQLHLALRRRLVEKIFLQLNNEPSFQKIDRIITLAVAEGGYSAHFNQGLRVKKHAGLLRFFYPQGRTNKRGDLTAPASESFEITVPGPGVYEFGCRTIEVSQLTKTQPVDELKNGGADYFDYDRLDFPLIIRSPKPGDRFYPFGGPGAKKVKDFLIDTKVARDKRPNVPLIISAGKVAGLLNLRPDKRFAICSSTVRVAKFVVI